MDWFTKLPELYPLLPDIEKAIATFTRLINDPDVQAAIETAKKVGALLAQPQPAPEPPSESSQA